MEIVSPDAEGEKAELHKLAFDPAEGEAAAASAALELIQGWLSEERQERLAIFTRGAVASAAGESPDPAAAWGLVRSAQAEHPGRFTLIDSDGTTASEEALEALLACPAEPQLALREGVALAPRAARMAPAEASDELLQDPERTVLITGATGGIGALIAQHLVEAHGARQLLLTSRSGEQAPGAADLRAILEEHGAEVRIAACDVAERKELEALLGSIPAEHPLGAVFHAAGVERRLFG